MPSPGSHRQSDVHPRSGAGITTRAQQPYARAAAACGASARCVWAPASYSTAVGSGRLTVSGAEETSVREGRGQNARQCGRAERAPGRRDWQHNRVRDGVAAHPRAGSRSGGSVRMEEGVWECGPARCVRP
eukprot:scaffold225_cov111-Isochrysis_galbana.AAC.7